VQLYMTDEMDVFHSVMKDVFFQKTKTGPVSQYPIDPWNMFSFDWLRSRLADEIGEWLRTLPQKERGLLLEKIHEVAYKSLPKPPEKRRFVHIANLAFIVWTAVQLDEARSFNLTGNDSTVSKEVK